MTEREADEVMERIEFLATGLKPDYWEVLLGHLYELHKLRDFYLWGHCSRLMYDKGWEAEHVDCLAKMNCIKA